MAEDRSTWAALRPRAEEPAWLAARRDAGFAQFEERGFPSAREEDWKQTSLGALAATTFAAAPAAAPVTTAVDSLTFGHAFPGHEIVLVNGRLARDLSCGACDGVEVLTLRDALVKQPALLEKHLGALTAEGTVFAALNAALFTDLVVLHVPDGVIAPMPFHVVHLSTGGATAVASHSRVLAVLGRGAALTLVESFGGPDGSVYLVNAATELVVGDGARLDHVKVQREGDAAYHVHTLGIRQGRDSHCASHAITFGAKLSRSDVQQAFAGPGSECVLNGLFLVGDSQHTDTRTRIDHAVPHCSSRQTYKGVLDGRARGVFVGRIVVQPGANGTDAQQTNNNLLLSTEALVHSVPQLEILNDDVKCKHGSTTGQLDPKALFYLRSRGIGEEAARALLTYAFASDLVSRIGVEPLRRGLEQHLQGRLPEPPEGMVS